MMVVALIGTITAIAVPVSTAMIARARGDSTAVEVQTWLQETRNRSIAERRNFEVTFDSIQHRIRIERLEPDASRTPVLLRDLPDGARFLLFDGAPDTPDRFGMGSAVDLDGPGPHLFTSDGSFIDGNGD